jgi:hypothetical protein
MGARNSWARLGTELPRGLLGPGQSACDFCVLEEGLEYVSQALGGRNEKLDRRWKEASPAS